MEVDRGKKIKRIEVIQEGERKRLRDDGEMRVRKFRERGLLLIEETYNLLTKQSGNNIRSEEERKDGGINKKQDPWYWALQQAQYHGSM